MFEFFFEVSEEKQWLRAQFSAFFRTRLMEENGVRRIQFCDTADYKSALQDNGWDASYGWIVLAYSIGPQTL